MVNELINSFEYACLNLLMKFKIEILSNLAKWYGRLHTGFDEYTQLQCFLNNNKINISYTFYNRGYTYWNTRGGCS